jgi:hypothetical protein
MLRSVIRKAPPREVVVDPAEHDALHAARAQQ